MVDIKPQVTLGNYLSYMVTPYNAWFRHLGYPLLDINTYEDGEWEIIQYHRSPVIPCLTQWSRVLFGIRRTECNFDFCKKWTDNLDAEKRWVWARMEEQERQTAEDLKREELHQQDMVNRQFDAIKNNPSLMNRIAKNGLSELLLWNISKHVPKHHFRGKEVKREGSALLHSSKPSSQGGPPGVAGPSSRESGANLRQGNSV